MGLHMRGQMYGTSALLTLSRKEMSRRRFVCRYALCLCVNISLIA